MGAEATKTGKAVSVSEEVNESSSTSSIAAAMEQLIFQLPAQRFASVLSRTLPEPVPPLVEAMAEDAKDNAEGLPLYANHLQFKANLLTTISNSLAALTGLAIWATLQESAAWWAKATVALAALVSAVLGFLPGIYHWSENAATARRLGSEYGHLYGDLLKVKGQFLNGTANVSDEGIEQLRTMLEALKKQRQEINAYWKK